MTLPEATRRRLEELAASADPVDAAVARRLNGRATHGASHPSALGHRPSRWQHVPLGALFSECGNGLEDRGDTIRTGHEPVHGSKSGACVVIWSGSGRWWCSSCHQAGDAATLVMRTRGVTYAEAAAFLTERYGPPTEGRLSGAALRRRVFTGTLP